MRREHPLIVLTVEALARQFGVEPTALWNAIDGKPTPRGLVDALVKAYYPGLREADFLVDEGSTSVPNGTKMRGNVQGQALIGGREGRPSLEHPFTRALHSKGITVTEWAAKHKVDRGTVKFWYMTGGRKIPRAMADLIQLELGVPATAKTWKNGIREPK
jgi:hypothetical protein